MSDLRFAYNTDGLQSHRLEDALALIADAGYAGVALTLDHMHLDPLRATPGEVQAVRRLLRRHGLGGMLTSCFSGSSIAALQHAFPEVPVTGDPRRKRRKS